MERKNRELTGKKRSRRISVRNKKGMGRDEAGETTTTTTTTTV